MLHSSQQQPDYHVEQHSITEKDKLAAAKQKLKEFKKNKAAAIGGLNNQHIENDIPNDLAINTINTIAASFITNGVENEEQLSLQSSSHRQPLNVDTIASDNVTTISSSSRSSLSPSLSKQQQQQVITSPSGAIQLPLINMSPGELNQTQFREQLKLHVQTIGILVAEKAELQSKLHQALKKIDKKQDECDELSGRLKASRQKITELEKRLESSKDSLSGIQSDQTWSSNENVTLRNELSSRELLVDELRMRLNESNSALEAKHDESKRMAGLIQELTTQLEMSQMKVQQLSSVVDHTGDDMKAILSNAQELDALKRRTQELEAQLAEANGKSDERAQQAQQAVERSHRQVENLVDQINRMTDERDELFAKLDSLQGRLNTANQLNDQLKNDLDAASAVAAAAQAQAAAQNLQQPSKAQKSHNDEQYIVKIDLLENEIKYFKQQIDILLKEDMQTRQALQDKEHSVMNLEKLLREYESEREKYSTLLEQSHSDKQTISRALAQNNELKSQLVELQDAFVRITQEKADLVTRLQAEEYKTKQLSSSAAVSHSPSTTTVATTASSPAVEERKETVVNGDHVLTSAVAVAAAASTSSSSSAVGSGELSPDWADEGVETDKLLPLDALSKGSSTLMDSIKQRLEYLERENKDLNNYITLVNKQLEEREDEKRNAGNEAALIRKLREQIEGLEAEKTNLYKKFQDGDVNNVSEEQQTKSFRLLEEKFKKVMDDNADLKEKNQQLEHMIQQLQFETETIVDYITMYQMERNKLSEKYRVKDELIRSLSTQLQVNKLALIEINNYLNAYIKLLTEVQQPAESEKEKPSEDQQQQETTSTSSDATSNMQRKKDYLLIQIQNLLVNVTSNTVAKLDDVSNAAKNEYNRVPTTTAASANEEKKQPNGFVPSSSSQPLNQNEMLSKAIQRFRNETVVCRDCYGDLFVV